MNELTMTPVDDLTPHPSNPRRGNIELIRESIRVNGFYGAVVAQLSTKTILAGEHRWKAARLEGMAEVPVIFIDCDDATAERIVLVDNRANDDAGYDDGLLADLLQSVQERDSLEGTGWTDDGLADLLLYMEGPPDQTGNDERLGPDDFIEGRVVVYYSLKRRDDVFAALDGLGEGVKYE